VDFDGYDEDETVKVVVRGNQEPVSVELTKEAMEVGQQELQSRILEAQKDAHAKCVLKNGCPHLYELSRTCNMQQQHVPL
jgi:DNA-binding protein YbaB